MALLHSRERSLLVIVTHPSCVSDERRGSQRERSVIGGHCCSGRCWRSSVVPGTNFRHGHHHTRCGGFLRHRWYPGLCVGLHHLQQRGCSGRQVRSLLLLYANKFFPLSIYVILDILNLNYLSTFLQYLQVMNIVLLFGVQ